MVSEAGRPSGGFIEKKRPSFVAEGQGNVSDDSSWENEKDEVVNATKFSSVRKSLVSNYLKSKRRT